MLLLLSSSSCALRDAVRTPRATIRPLSSTKTWSALRTVLKRISVASGDELDFGFTEIARNGCQALLVMASSVYFGVRRQLVDLARRYRVPAIYDNRLFVADGGMMAYGPDTREMYRRAASYVDIRVNYSGFMDKNFIFNVRRLFGI